MPDIAVPFAGFGSEKMVYDGRMGPQCLFVDGAYFCVFQANRRGGHADPHIIRRDADGTWGKPVRLGRTTGGNHHYAPVLWLDAARHLHVLYHCHFVLDQSRHLVSRRPLDLTAWDEAAPIAPSISYPRLIRLGDGRLLLYYRVLGHMGYWTYRISSDGGATWGPAVEPLVDFDHRPEVPGDEWAGSYHSVALDPDGRHLHVALVRWDERNRVNPIYRRFVNLWSRYDLHYLRLDPDRGIMRNIDGDELPRPLNRRQAREGCQVWDTGEHLTNMPAILVAADGSPQFLMPVAGDRLDRCGHWFISRAGGTWRRRLVTSTDNIWNAAHLERAADGGITAFLVVRGRGRQPERLYGGGRIEEWHADAVGRRWRKVGDVALPRGYLANNPKPVEDVAGRMLPRSLMFFGWPGPEAIPPAGPYTGSAYLWRDGTWL